MCLHAFADSGFLFRAAVMAYAKTEVAIISQNGRIVTVDMTRSAVDTPYPGYTERCLIQLGGEVGDIMIDGKTNTVFYVAARTVVPGGNPDAPRLMLTLVAQNNYDAQGQLRSPITNSDIFYALNCRLYTPAYVTYGDYAMGSATITNVQRPDGAADYLNTPGEGVQIGDYLWVGNGQEFNPTKATFTTTAAQIIAIAGNSITLDSTLKYTQARVRQQLFVRAAPPNATTVP